MLVGFIEVKAPGKGADPRRFRDRHDKQQWEKLQSLPNLIYTDGNEYSLWRNGDLTGSVVCLVGDVETSGIKLDAPPILLGLFEDFFGWQPIPPREPRQLAEMSARLCRLLREEVAEQLALKSPALTALATDWRKLLFPEASDTQFADGYAQVVTFGMLMARARNIQLNAGLDQVARQLGKTNSLIGAALRLLTDDAENQATLKTSLGTLTRVLDAVDWPTISKGQPDAWLYFYENFLEVYDNELRKQTGSYYTPPQVVDAMVRLVDQVLGNIQPDHWVAEYTTELINVLHVIGRLITLEPSQARLLEQICSAPTIATDELRAAGSFEKSTSPKRSTPSADESMQMSLIDE